MIGTFLGFYIKWVAKREEEPSEFMLCPGSMSVLTTTSFFRDELPVIEGGKLGLPRSD